MSPWPEIHVENWEAFQRQVDSIYCSRPEEYNVFLFRGQPDVKWTLKPTLLREFHQRYKEDITRFNADRFENRTIREARRYNHLYRQMSGPDTQDQDVVDLWALIRHYGGPARVLDWSVSPYVALYFAVRDAFEVDGCVWWVSYGAVNDRRRERYPVSADPEKEKKFDKDSEDCRLFFSEINLPTHRAAAQQGMLSVCEDLLADHADVLSWYMEKSLTNRWFGRIVVPSEKKREFLLRLRSMNVTARSLFPDMVGLGMSIEELLRSLPTGRNDPYQFKDDV